MRARMLCGGLLVCSAVALGVPAVATAQGSIDLLSQFTLRLDGAARSDSTGQAVNSAGDVNGDGFDDVIVGAPNSIGAFRPGGGMAYVVYGRPARAMPEILDAITYTDPFQRLGDRGFAINGSGQPSFGHAGTAVAPAGDVNGDGLDDLIVGEPHSHPNVERLRSGAAYVVYGRRMADIPDVNLQPTGLEPLSDKGFVILGAGAEFATGIAVDGTGDVNGDGLDDVVVGAHLAALAGRDPSGVAYVVYGRREADPPDVDLAALGARGQVLAGERFSRTGYDVAGPGDVNGDGVPDIVVGAPSTNAADGSRNAAGAAYVVYGTQAADPPDLDLGDSLGTRGARILGHDVLQNMGSEVSGAGDVNGDGRGDIIIGSSPKGENGLVGSTAAFVVYGQTAADLPDVDLATAAARTQRIDIPAIFQPPDPFGLVVDGAGDFNADGVDDVVLGSIGASPLGRPSAGTAFVVFGQRTADPPDVHLSTLGARGVLIPGAEHGDVAGAAVAGAGDFDGDGRADVIVGARDTSHNDRPFSGSAYVVSPTSPLLVPNRPPVALDNTAAVVGGATLSVSAPGVLGNDSDPDGDALTAQLVTTTAQGALTLNANGSFTYIPGEDAAGTDTFTYRAFDGTLSSNVATLTITITPGCEGRRATVVGTPAANVLKGTGGADVIAGLGGNDTIDGGSDNDTICGGSGADALTGGSGNDVLRGGSGADQLGSGSGNDVLRGEDGNDVLDGGGDNDQLFGGAGVDRLLGGGDADRLDGGEGTPDRCDGEGGTDTATACETVVSVP